MPREALESVLRYLRHAAESHQVRDLTDAELLERFLARDEAAFTLLVQRHGPMVMGVCRRLLGEHHGAEDAFQATYLVLCRNAAATLKLCFDTKEGKKLPTEFAAKTGSGMILLTLKHEPKPPQVKPQEKPDRTTAGASKPQVQDSKSPATPAAGASPAGTGDKKTKEATATAELDGSYTVVEAISTEKKRPGQATTTVGFIRKCRVTIKEGVMSFVQGDPDVDGERADVKFTLDPSKEPGRIDLEPLPPEGSEWVNPSSTLPGIYRVNRTDKGLELTIAWVANSQGKRPETFDGKAPAEVVVRLLRKDK